MDFVLPLTFPERYDVLPEVRHMLTTNGFEVGVQGLNHGGKLYQSRKIFQERAYKINNYLKDWNAVGFCSPVAHHNLEWIKDLNIEYDLSTFDTDPFEPQNDGMGTIFPFWVRDDSNKNRYLELPYTLPQDSTLFIIMREKTINIWMKKLDWLAENGGMALVNVHPDYLNFTNSKFNHNESFSVEYYIEFLKYIKSNYEGQYWHALPVKMARFWSSKYARKNYNA